MGRRSRVAAAGVALLLACGGDDDSGDAALASNPNAVPDLGAPAPTSAPPAPGSAPSPPLPTQPPAAPPAAVPGTPAAIPPGAMPPSVAVPPPPATVPPPPRLFPTLPSTPPPPPPRPDIPPSQPPPPLGPLPQPMPIPLPPGPLPPPPSPADFSGFGCEPPRCLLHGVAPHPAGGFAVFREFLLGSALDVGRGEGVSELVGVDGSVRRIAPGVVVLSGEFDARGNLRALVEPQWDSAAGAFDTAVTDVRAIVELTPAGEVASVREVDAGRE